MSEADFCCDEGACLAAKAQYEREQRAPKRKETKAMNLKTAKPGEMISDRMVLVKAEIRKTKTNKPYLAATFGDGSDQVAGNIWDWNDNLPPAGVYIVNATVGEYMGKKQLNNIKMLWDENQDMAAFSLHYTEDLDSPYRSINKLIDDIQNEGLKAIVREVYDAVHPEYIYASSALGVHHVGIGGNLCHTLEVTELAADMAVRLVQLGYDVDVDLCIAGALLHDIGKIDTYTVNGPTVEMTLSGSLSDHIALGIRRLRASEASKKYFYTASLLEHIILSHHGSKEYGSPVTPKFMEAYVVCHADGLSAVLNTLRSYNDKADAEQRPGLMTERIFTANNCEHLRQGAVQDMLHENSGATL